MTIQTEIDRFLAQHQARSQHTSRTYQTGLNHFLAYLEEKGILPGHSPKKLTRRIALEFIPWLATTPQARTGGNLSMRSRNLYVRAVSGLYRQLALEGTIPLSFGDFAALNEQLGKATQFNSVPLDRKLPPEKVMQKVLAAVREEGDDTISKRNKAIILCLYSSGMRVSELTGLHVQDLDQADHGAWVNGKGDKTRFVCFNAEAWDALLDYLDDREEGYIFLRHDIGTGGKDLPLASGSVNTIIRQVCGKAGVTFHLTAHSFRHYFATRLLQGTSDLALTQDALGHASPNTTRIYARTSKQQLEKAHKALF